MGEKRSREGDRGEASRNAPPPSPRPLGLPPSAPVGGWIGEERGISATAHRHRRAAAARARASRHDLARPRTPRTLAASPRAVAVGEEEEGWVLVLPVGEGFAAAGPVALFRGCFSFGSGGRRRPAASPLPSPPRAPPLASSASATAAALAAADDGAKMKGLFKSKPRTPADVVRQTREHLIFLDIHSGSRGGDAKREEKVRSNTQLLLFFFAAPSPLLRTFVPDRS